MFSRYKDKLDNEMRSSVLLEDSEINLIHRYFLGWVEETGCPSILSETRGKRLRPILCLFTCDALSGSWEKAMPAAVALELIHCFSMIHDDIQDEDVERHHRPTVWSIWGQSKALIAGNAMNSLGGLVALDLEKNGFSEDKSLRASLILTESCLSMIEGQCLDIAFEERVDITTVEYLDMIGGKTEALIKCATYLGSLLSVDDESTIQEFRRFGSQLGGAFQIRDDVLGVWGKEALTGKAVGNDIRRRKKSYPVIYSLENSTGKDKDELIRIYLKERLSEEDVGRVFQIMENVQALEYSNRLINKMLLEARNVLDHIELPDWARSELDELINFLSSREF